MFGGSYAHAAVLDGLEFLTNGKIALLEAGDSVSDPWFEASCAALINACIGLYGRTKILACLEDFEGMEIVRSRQGQRGTPKEYLLDYKSVTKLLQNGSTIPPADQSITEPPPVQNWTGTRPELNHPPSKTEPVLYNAVRTHRNALEPSLPSQEELPFETFAKIVLSKYKQARGTKVDSGRQDKRRLLDWLGESSRTQAEVFSALDAFLADDFWAKEKFPLPAFIKQFGKYLDHKPEAAMTLEEPTISTPESTTKTEISDRDFPAEWNSVVYLAPVAWDPARSLVASLNKCAKDPVFCERFSEVCVLALKCHASRPGDVGWLSFEWIIKQKPGEAVGWWRLLNDMRWMSEPPVQKKSELERMMGV